MFLWYGPDQFYAYFLTRISIPYKVLSICINLKSAPKNKHRTDLNHTKETRVSDRVQIALGWIRSIQISKGKTLMTSSRFSKLHKLHELKPLLVIRHPVIGVSKNITSTLQVHVYILALDINMLHIRKPSPLLRRKFFKKLNVSG